MVTSAAANPPAEGDKTPRTERGRKTLRKLLDAAAKEFGEKGFHEGSISGITRRAGVALGSFYTYFDTKDEVFRALVKDLSSRVGQEAREAMAEADGALEAERVALESFLRFARENKEIYRIIDESEFVDPECFRRHNETTAERILARLHRGAATGELQGKREADVAESDDGNLIHEAAQAMTRRAVRWVGKNQRGTSSR